MNCTRCFLLAAFIISGIIPAYSQKIYGEMPITFGKVKRFYGYESVAGYRISYVAEKIPANESYRGGDPRATAYLNDNGDGTYFFTDQNPSSLDDLVLDPVGQGQPWKHLTVGINGADTHQFLIRWIVYDTFIQGLGAGVSAFYDVLADFGGFFQLPSGGAWKITFDISIIGMTVPDGECYFAQQFREPDPSGEGNFDFAFSTVFSGGGATTGTSEDVFWYDIFPLPDGVYDETEVDYFGGSPNEANFLLGITTGGKSNDVFPITFTIEKGTLKSGSLVDLWYSDESKMQILPQPGALRDPPVVLVVESVAPSSNVLSLSFTLEASVTREGIDQKIELYNFQTQKWDTFDTRSATTTDSSVTVTVGSNPLKYVETGSRKIRSRVSWKWSFTSRFTTRVDQTMWKIVTP
ncbi:MAG TPA: hypothetical protein VNK96_06430 [Fimbriimonadales bacterium]|nr:hypothetical protein [Fimbriimonadales bacterium]